MKSNNEILSTKLLNDEFYQLLKSIKSSGSFNLIFVEHNKPSFRDEIIQKMEAVQHNSAVIDLSYNKIPTFYDFEKELKKKAKSHNIIHLINIHKRDKELKKNDKKFKKFIEGLNFHREQIAQLAPVNIFFWVLEYLTKEFITGAPDLWAWNSYLFNFSKPEDEMQGLSELQLIEKDTSITELNLPGTKKRIKNLIDFLKIKDLSELNNAEKLLSDELDNYYNKILLYEKIYNYLDKDLKTYQTEIETFNTNTLIQYPKKILVTKNKKEQFELINEYAGKLKEKGRYSLALEQKLKAKELLDSHENKIKIPKYFIDELANHYYLNGEYSKAKNILINYLLSDIDKSEFNQNEIATLYNNIALTYNYLGDYEKALEYHQKAYDILEKVLEPNHPSIATSYNNIAETCSDLGNNKKALEYHLKAIAIRKKVLEPNHPDLATSYNNIANTYSSLGNYEKALEYNLKAIAILKKVLETNHPSLAIAYNNIAATYLSLGNYEKSLEYHLKAIDILEKVLEPTHPDLATSYNNISLTYRSLGNYEKAMGYNLKSIAILEKVLEPNHPSLATSYLNIAATYYYLKKYKQAKHHIDKAVKIFKKALPAGHPNIKAALSWQEEINRQQ
ncbi:MAG: tetratricopeptide repeat protein [Bacteroidales bacterium]|nr:tetratricopeptide repeat protein [Bacteroidales bacterium]